MRAVNLLPRDDARRTANREQQVLVFIAAAGFILVTTGLAIGYLTSSKTVADRQAELDSVNAELALTPPPEAATGAEASLPVEQQQRLTALSAAMARRVAWDRILRELSLVLPEDVWIKDLQMKAPASPAATVAPVPTAPAAVPAGFRIDGYTYSHEAVARLLARLAVVPNLMNVQLQSAVRVTLPGGTRVINFVIAADVRRAGLTS